MINNMHYYVLVNSQNPVCQPASVLTFRQIQVSFLMPNHAIIVAAGAGRRFGGLKQFLDLNGKPLVLHAIERFEREPSVDAITVVVPQSRVAFMRKLAKAWNLKKVRHIVGGGRRRQDSILNALQRIRQSEGCLIIHDGVRPLFLQGIIRKGIRLCRTHKAVIIGAHVRETMKEVKRGAVMRTVPRKNLFLIKTPQFFDCRLLRHAYHRANLAVEYTDDAALCESLNIPVYCMIDDSFNLKVTTRGDIALIRRML
jgi:2-C-methyl-D-erythritol 4-phosphate cytidylyltransferase